MPHFGQSPRWAQISILKILNVFLRLRFSPVLTLTKLKRFEIGSKVCGIRYKFEIVMRYPLSPMN